MNPCPEHTLTVRIHRPLRRACRRGLWALASASLLVGVEPPARALNFQVRETETEFDGRPRRQQYFDNDARSRVFIELPANWNNVGEPGSLTMTQSKLVGCSIRLEKSSLSPSTPFADKGLEVYQKAALATVPQGAVNARIVEGIPDAFPLHNWTTYEFMVAYEYFGQSFQRGVLFANLNAQEQLLVSTVAPKEQYQRVRTETTEVLRTWQVVPIKPAS